ncbi:MAG: aminotransferase class V-fold PLP-dependent enzyme [Merismopedia sp. SIO2A8]|nr:aminotransferase class V-fold PLP-dependent enzyme [Merismopedia sp. SIO2A8]
MDQLTRHRQEFPALQDKTYFNFGGQGPMPQRAIATITQAHQRLQELGPFSYQSYLWSAKETEKTRQAIAAELQIPSQTVTLTENVLTGCNIPLWGTLWRPGDHILLSDCEYPAVVATVQELQHRFGIEYSFCPLMDTLNGGDPLSILTQHLRPKTRLVILSHILWNTGQVLPIKEMIQACHDYGRQGDQARVRVLVDAAQSVGVLPLNLTELNADFYAFTGHKWWCGPGGVGALYINPDAYDSIRPTFIGWRGVLKDDQGDPIGFESDGKRFEVSTYDVTALMALREAIALHNEWGTATERYQRIITLSKYLWQQLTQIPQLHCFRTTPPESGLIFFRLQQPAKDEHTAIVRELEEKGFQLRTILNPNCIRACVNYLTLESEIDALVDVLKAVLSQHDQ